MGYPPLVTPTSQIVGTQAVLNVLLGERYKMASNEVKAYFRGEYGTPPGEINDEIREKVIGDAEVITCRPADLLPPSLEEAKKEIGPWAKSMEDILMYILFPQVAKPFLVDRMAGETNTEYDMLGTEQNTAGKDVNYIPV